MAYEDIVVVIDPGHGGQVTEGKEASNGGAMYHDLFEKDINLITAKAIKEELESYENVTVYLTREDDRELSLDARVDYAASLGADFLISVHYNASEDHNFFGSEIFVSAFGECYSRGYDMADQIMLRWLDFGNTKKDIKTRIGESGQDYYGLIRLGQAKNLPTIILEHGYLDNDEDFLRIKDEKAWIELGKADAQGIADYYGLKKDYVLDSVKPISKTKAPKEPVMPDTTGPEDVKLTITNYDPKTGEMDFAISAKDNESKLMYYGFVKEEATEETVFPELFLWDNSKGMVKGSINIGKGYKGPVTATVFNVYQINTNSNVCSMEDYSKDSTNDIDEDNLSKEFLAEEDNPQNSNDTIEKGTDDDNDEPNSEDIREEKSQETDTNNGSDGIIVTKDKYYSKGVSDEVLAKAVEDSVDSTVEKSYRRFLVLGLISSMILSVLLVLVVSGKVRKSKKKRKDSHDDGYDW